MQTECIHISVMHVAIKVECQIFVLLTLLVGNFFFSHFVPVHQPNSTFMALFTAWQRMERNCFIADIIRIHSKWTKKFRKKREKEEEEDDEEKNATKFPKIQQRKWFLPISSTKHQDVHDNKKVLFLLLFSLDSCKV